MSDRSGIDNWLERFPRTEAEQRVRALEHELAGLREAIALHDSFSRLNGVGNDNASEQHPSGARPPNRPAAIRQILRERGNEPMLPSEIREGLVERGWLMRSESKHFYAAMSTITKRGHLLRLQDGRYMLSQKYMLPRDQTGANMAS